MALAAGTLLGPYAIVSPLGAGGMGEVYRARDTRLGRDVAVKVLPRHLSESADVRARFEREARAVSSLNHPHICTLHDVGREGETDYLVMELIEGETLADRLAKGPLPPADVSRLGAQIADALDRAHRAGIVHRDLKPGNIMLTRSGAKLMDFGLARAAGLDGTGGDGTVAQGALSQSPTLSQPLTAAGTIIGTFRYLSPEQLEGREADARSDLWALGCVLYEMATGARAFSGGSQASLISSIMKDEPRAITELVPMSPPALERIVRACLAKDPEERLQTAHDVKLQLRWIAESGPDTGTAALAAGPSRRSRRRLVLRALPWCAGVLGLAALAWSGYARLAARPATLSVQVPVPASLHLTPYWSNHAISPDGQAVVASGRQGDRPPELWLWHLKSALPSPLPGTAGGYFPAWSPDSRSVAFFRIGENGLFRVPVAGGPATRVCGADWGRGVSWGRGGDLVFAPGAAGPLQRVSAGGGDPQPATALDASRGEIAHRFPCFLPDGEHFLFAALPAGPDGYGIYLGKLGTLGAKPVMRSDCAPVYAEPGYLVFAQGGKIMVQRFDLGRLETVGERLAIADAPAASDFTAEPVATVSRDQRLLFPSNVTPDAQVEWLDRTGASRGVVPLPAGAWNVGALSRDSRFATATTGRELWRIDLERAVATRLAGNIRAVPVTAWSPDGRRIAMDLEAGGRARIVVLSAGGSGAADTLRGLGTLFQEVADWSPDGQSLLVAAIDEPDDPAAEPSWNLWLVPLAGDAAPVPYLRTPGFERVGRISPDGRWLAYEVVERGRGEIFIDSFPVPGHRVLITTDGSLVQWGRDGRELLFVQPGRELVSVPLDFAGDEVRPGAPTRLFRLPGGATGLDTRDGERFLVSHAGGAETARSLQLVLGWTGLVPR